MARTRHSNGANLETIITPVRRGSQAEAERRKRASILESEGARQSKINVEEGNKAGIILASEAAQQDSVNRAIGAHPSLLLSRP